MATILNDALDGGSVQKKYNSVVFLTRKFIVIGLDGETYATLFDALENAGIPAYGTSLAEAPNCVVKRSEVKMIDGDKAEVTITYEEALGEDYDMDSPPFGVIFGNGSCAVSQVQTNLDKDGAAPSVSYDYPSDHPDTSLAGKTIAQGALFDFLQPQLTLTFEGMKADDTPSATAKGMIGKTNDGSWNGGDAGTWFCTKAKYDLFDPASSPARYKWQLEFQYNPDGWDPAIILKDETTGLPPADLVNGVGYKTVERYEQVSFDTAFGATLVGE